MQPETVEKKWEMPQKKINQRTDASVKNTETGTQSTDASVNLQPGTEPVV